MKIKSVFFFALFSLLASQVFAKENAIKSDLDTKISIEKKDSREEIKSFDFDKLFAQAEKYFKEAKAWQKIECTPKNGFICTKHECNKRESISTLILDKKEKTITRCSGKDCETFPAEFEQTGVYFNIQTKGPVGTLIRILGDSRYKEITTVALDAYIANGECKVVTE
ncbi:MAG: hypothetical protein KGP29_03435 [Proteobacteria bacterium]|nr:hypothetical protein [Pseudomonadota bacterium]